MTRCAVPQKSTRRNKVVHVTEYTDGLRIASISKAHKHDAFPCGKPSLDDYLHLFARQNNERNIATTFVAVDEKQRVFGYYTLSTTHVAFSESPAPHQNRLPEYPVPAAVIAKQAVDSTCRGQGLGTRLLIDALPRILSDSNKLGMKVVLVDALDSDVRWFYRRFGFLELPNQDLQLFLPIETVRQLF